jgi:hypothetical protein
MSRWRGWSVEFLTLIGCLSIVALVAGCGVASTGSTARPTEPVSAPASSATATSSWPHGPGTPEYDGIPQPIVDSLVDGWWRYLGEGRFVTESGREFFWRDGRFVNADGTLMEIPESAKEHLLSLGIDRQPTRPLSLAPERQALAEEVERIRRGVIDGTLVFQWDPPPGSDFPSDPREVLDSLEKSAYLPDVYLYLRDSATDAKMLGEEIGTMPEIEEWELFSKDQVLRQMQREFADSPEILESLEAHPFPATIWIWLREGSRTDDVLRQFRRHPDVDEAKAPSIDFAQWTKILREMTHATAP